MRGLVLAAILVLRGHLCELLLLLLGLLLRRLRGLRRLLLLLFQQRRQRSGGGLFVYRDGARRAHHRHALLDAALLLGDRDALGPATRSNQTQSEAIRRNQKQSGDALGPARREASAAMQQPLRNSSCCKEAAAAKRQRGRGPRLGRAAGFAAEFARLCGLRAGSEGRQRGQAAHRLRCLEVVSWMATSSAVTLPRSTSLYMYP